MLDRQGRRIDYLRISITDRCNLRCTYCLPQEGVASCRHQDILRFEEIERIVRAAVRLGFRRVRLTGGEPLVRRGAVDLVRSLAAVPGLQDLAITTNGLLLEETAADLRRAGLHRVNISLDTLRRDRFATITRRDSHPRVMAGLRAALEQGLTPVKINAILQRGLNDDEAEDLVRFGAENGVTVRFIELMPLGTAQDMASAARVPGPELRQRLGRRWRLTPLERGPTGKGGGPAVYYRVEELGSQVGFIDPMSGHFCHTCNRLRLTAEGQLQTCLASPGGVDLRPVLRRGAEEEELAVLIAGAIAGKPKRHAMGQGRDGWRHMSKVGG